ncbi:MAG TPA: DUF5808 domain-containing protein [Bacteroidota bacterium]|nr:DUF5808 domain-containing protein [Bacteroidota bacterium]
MEDSSQNWKWGVFYFNREDKRLLVPKQITGTGWTLNFAKPVSFVIILVPLLLFIAAFSLRR